MSDFNFQFKAGDKVYYPKVSNKVLTLENAECSNYSVKISLESGMIRSFMIDGKHFHLDLNPSIFPATQEWYEKLVHIYPDLEKPPVKKTPKEIIQAMLDDGWDCVPCYVHDENKTPNKNNRREIISEARNYSNYPFVTDTMAWEYATPFDPKTGKVIVDYIDGEVVLEG